MFYEDLSSCVKFGVCDTDVAADFFCKRADDFATIYAPIVSTLSRRVSGDVSYSDGMMEIASLC